MLLTLKILRVLYGSVVGRHGSWLGEEGDKLFFDTGEPDGQIGWDQGVEFGQGAIEHQDGHKDEQDAAD